MSGPTVEQIKKLPVWAQNHIEKLNRERNTAVKALNEYCDSQTPAAFYTDEAESTGEVQGPSFKRRFFQGNSINVSYAGVYASIFLPRKDDGQRHFGIEIKFDPALPKSSFERVAIIPGGWNSLYLVAKENL